jgi:hypothetical protein
MKTLIVPCGGKSSRFPNMKPKYLLTYPDGNLMVKKSLEGMNLAVFDNIVVTIVREHDEVYGAKLILEQVFDIEHNHKFVICVLDEFTSCQAETIIKTIEKERITGKIVIKDSDNCVKFNNDKIFDNAIVGLNIETYVKEINRLSSKSFLAVNDQGIIVDIIEKKIKSQHICLGVYCFSDVNDFINGYNDINNNNIEWEIYISHVISYLIGTGKCIFKYIEAEDFEDWGTLLDWRIVQERQKTYFIDLDGVLLNNRGKYGVKNWSNCMEPLEENIKVVKRLYDNGAQIVITTSREEIYRKDILNFFAEKGITIHALVTGLKHSCRVIINDFAPTNPYPSCESVNIKRNGDLADYI